MIRIAQTQRRHEVGAQRLDVLLKHQAVQLQLLHGSIVHQTLVNRIVQLVGKHHSLIGRQTIVNLNIHIGSNTHQHFKLQFGKRHGIPGRDDTRFHAAHLHLGGNLIELADSTLPILGIDDVIIVFRQFIAFLQHIV